MPTGPPYSSFRGFARTTWVILALLVFVVGQSGDCEQDTGNTDLTLLELEGDGQNFVVGFTSAQRIYDVSVPLGVDPLTLRAQSVEPGATISLTYVGTSTPSGSVAARSRSPSTQASAPSSSSLQPRVASSEAT